MDFLFMGKMVRVSQETVTLKTEVVGKIGLMDFDTEYILHSSLFQASFRDEGTEPKSL